MKKMVNIIAASFVVPFVLNAACPYCQNGGHNENQEYYSSAYTNDYYPGERINKGSTSYSTSSNAPQSRFYSGSTSTQNQSARLHENQQGKFLTDDDEDILAEVSEILADPSLTQNGRDMTIEVVNGVVTIRGEVLSEDEKENIQGEIEDIDGVTSVILNLHIQNLRNGQSADKSNSYYYQTSLNDNNNALNKGSAQAGGQKLFSDEELKDRVEKKIHHAWFAKDFSHVRVTVSNGVVTLRGSVDSRDDFNDLKKRLSTVPGIVDINNQVTVRDYYERENKRTSYFYRPFF